MDDGILYKGAFCWIIIQRWIACLGVIWDVEFMGVLFGTIGIPI